MYVPRLRQSVVACKALYCVVLCVQLLLVHTACCLPHPRVA